LIVVVALFLVLAGPLIVAAASEFMAAASAEAAATAGAGAVAEGAAGTAETVEVVTDTAAIANEAGAANAETIESANALAHSGDAVQGEVNQIADQTTAHTVQPLTFGTGMPPSYGGAAEPNVGQVPLGPESILIGLSFIARGVSLAVRGIFGG